MGLVTSNMDFMAQWNKPFRRQTQVKCKKTNMLVSVIFRDSAVLFIYLVKFLFFFICLLPIVYFGEIKIMKNLRVK